MSAHESTAGYSLIVTAGLIGSILCIGTAGFHVLEGYTFFDAFYMTLTISTVWYTEIHSLARAGRIFNSFLIFFGITAMFLAIGSP